jgi:diguanylate cyclase (GGDEF)-like protein
MTRRGPPCLRDSVVVAVNRLALVRETSEAYPVRMQYSIRDDSEELQRAIRVSQAVNRVRQMPMVFVANPLLALFLSLFFWNRTRTELLIAILALMIVILTPAILSWQRLRFRARPEQVSTKNETRAVIFAVALGVLWGILVFALFPIANADERAMLVVFMIALTGGSVSFFSSSPFASLGFFLPFMIPLLIMTIRFDQADLPTLPSVVAVFILTAMFFTRTAWEEFVASVRLLVERDEALAESKASSKQLAQALSRMQDLAMVDELTGLKNRRAFFDDAEPAVAAARRRKQPIAVALLDLDFFKDVNDTYGHAVGDLVLKEVARRITGTLREEQIVGRLGGEEFVALLPDTTPAQALIAIERVRKAIGATQIPLPGGGPAITVTISGGIAPVLEDEGLESVIDLADKAMYRAKGLGRDRVEVFGV